MLRAGRERLDLLPPTPALGRHLRWPPARWLLTWRRCRRPVGLGYEISPRLPSSLEARGGRKPQRLPPRLLTPPAAAAASGRPAALDTETVPLGLLLLNRSRGSLLLSAPETSTPALPSDISKQTSPMLLFRGGYFPLARNTPPSLTFSAATPTACHFAEPPRLPFSRCSFPNPRSLRRRGRTSAGRRGACRLPFLMQRCLPTCSGKPAPTRKTTWIPEHLRGREGATPQPLPSPPGLPGTRPSPLCSSASASRPTGSSPPGR